MGTGLILALDFGGTKLSAGVYSVDSGKWLGIQREFSNAGISREDDLESIFSLAKSQLGGKLPAAVGASFGGPVDFQTGTVRLSHHVPGWENIPLKALLEKEFHSPAVVDNDANAAALGEYHFGAGIGVSSLCYLTISTGVGGGWVLNDAPWRGWGSMAGEIGHMVVDPAGPMCLCGKRGCVERLASGPFMAEDIRSELESRMGSDVQSAGGGVLFSLAEGKLEQITAKLVAEAASQGDELAWKYLSRSAWAIGTAIGNAANLINPQRFILGGGVTKAGDRFWETLKHAAARTALPEVSFDIVPSGLGDDAPLWGAVSLAQFGDR